MSAEQVAMERQQSPSPDEATGLADADLARLIAAAGHEPAVDEEAELCRRFERRIYLYGLRHLRTEDRAHDLVQEVLVVTLEKLRAGAVREPARIGSFILGVARLVARSMDRSGTREEPVEAAGEFAAVAGPSVTAPLARDRVVRCLEALAERPRTIVMLTYYAEQSTATIATSLGLSPNNVRVIRHRGIEQLRVCFGFAERGKAA